MVLGKNSLRRTATEWETYAKAPLIVKAIDNAIYAFGSELAILRLFHKFHGAPKAVAQPNIGDMSSAGEWFFRLEMSNSLTFGNDWIEV